MRYTHPAASAHTEHIQTYIHTVLPPPRLTSGRRRGNRHRSAAVYINTRRALCAASIYLFIKNESETFFFCNQIWLILLLWFVCYELCLRHLLAKTICLCARARLLTAQTIWPLSKCTLSC